MLRVVVVLGLIGAAAWLLWDPGPDNARTAQREGFDPTDQEDEQEEGVDSEEDGSPAGFYDHWTPPALSVVEVVDPDGRPVAGALVVAFDFDLKTLRDRRIATSVTDAGGLAHFDELAASEVKARKSGYAVGSARTGDEGRVRIALQPSLAVRGRAVVHGGGPAVGATIHVWDGDKVNDHVIDFPQTAGEDGGFSLTGIRAHHPFIVVATYRGYAPVVTKLPEPGDVLVTFGDGLTLTGDIVDESGNPVAATVVVARAGAKSPFERDSTQLGYEERELMTMARPNCGEGSFSVLGMQPGMYDVYARGGGGIGKTSITLDEDRHVQVRVVRLATLVVTIVGPNGEKIEHDYVDAHRDDEWESCRGGEKMVLKPGRYVISANGESYRGILKEIDLKPGEERAIEMRLLKGLAVTGRVVDEQGKPIVGAQAGIRQKTVGWDSWEQGTKSSKSGAWGAQGLAPGKGTLHVVADGYYDHRREIEVADGAHYTVRMELRGKIIGRFVPPPKDKRLTIEFDYANGSSSGSTDMRDDGSFEVEDPAVDGLVTVTLAPKGQTPVVLRDFEFRRGQIHDLGALQVVAGVMLRLTVLDRAGKPIKGALVEIRDPGYVPGLRTDGNGYLEVKDQPQKLALRVVADGHAAVYVRVNATQPVTIRLARGVAVSGSVWDPTGEPAAHAYVVFWKMRADGTPDDAEAWKPDVDGKARFSFLLPPGKFRVRVYGKHRQLLAKVFEAKEGARFELRMR